MKHISAIFAMVLAVVTLAAGSVISTHEKNGVNEIDEGFAADSLFTTSNLATASISSETTTLVNSISHPTANADTPASVLSTSNDVATVIGRSSGPSIITTWFDSPLDNPSLDYSRVPTIRRLVALQYFGEACWGDTFGVAIEAGNFGDPMIEDCFPLFDNATRFKLGASEGCVTVLVQDACDIPMGFSNWDQVGYCENIEITGRTNTNLWYRCDGR